MFTEQRRWCVHPHAHSSISVCACGLSRLARGVCCGHFLVHRDFTSAPADHSSFSITLEACVVSPPTHRAVVHVWCAPHSAHFARASAHTHTLRTSALAHVYAACGMRHAAPRCCQCCHYQSVNKSIHNVWCATA